MTKSGKPDMRYKENKSASSSSATVTGSSKKDDSLDMHYKANKSTKTTSTRKS